MSSLQQILPDGKRNAGEPGRSRNKREARIKENGYEEDETGIIRMQPNSFAVVEW